MITDLGDVTTAHTKIDSSGIHTSHSIDVDKTGSFGRVNFDGVDGHTFIQETADDTLKIFVGGEAKMEFAEGSENIFMQANNYNFRDASFNSSFKIEANNHLLSGSLTSTGSFGKIDAVNNIDLPDNGNIRFGIDADMNIVHNGTDTFIDNYTGHLNIRNNANDKDIVFISDDGSGGVTEYFRLDGDTVRVEAPKSFRWADGARAQFGASSDLQVYHDGTDSFITNGTGDLHISQSASDKDILFSVNDGGTILAALKIDASDVGAVRLPNDSQKLLIGAGDDLRFQHNGSHSFIQQYGTGDLYIDNTVDDGNIIFRSDDESGGVKTYLQLDGGLGYMTAQTHMVFDDNALVVLGTGSDLQIYHDGTHNYVDINNGNLYFRDDADNNIFLIYREGNGVQLTEGNITIPGTSKVIFDGATSGHSHIAESSADIMDFTVGGDLMLRLDEASNIVNVPQSRLIVSGSDLWSTGNQGGSTDNVVVLQLGRMIDSPNNALVRFYADDALDLIEYNMLRYGAKHRFTRGSAAGGRVNMMTVEGSATTQFKLWHQSNNVGGGDTTGSAVIYLNATTGSGQSYINSGGGLSIATGSVIIGGTSATNSKLNVKSEGSTQSVIRIDGDDGRGANRYALDIVDDDSNSRGSVRISTTSGPSLIVNGDVTGSIATTASFGRIEADSYSLATLTEVSGGLESTGSFGNLEVKNHILLPDSAIVNLGNGRDLKLKHDGNSTITNTSGNITISNQADDKDIIFKTDDGSGGTTAYITLDGSATSILIGKNTEPSSDDAIDLGSASKRFQDVFAVQTTVGAVFETGLRSKGIGKEETGTIVVWRNGGLVPCDKSEDTMVMGVTKKGKDEPIVMGAEPVLVTGDVKEGDFITTSTKQGHGKKLENGYLLKKEMFGKVIAQALEDSSGESSLIKCMIRKM